MKPKQNKLESIAIAAYHKEEQRQFNINAPRKHSRLPSWQRACFAAAADAVAQAVTKAACHGSREPVRVPHAAFITSLLSMKKLDKPGTVKATGWIGDDGKPAGTITWTRTAEGWQCSGLDLILTK